MSDTCNYYKYDGGFFGSGNTCSVNGKTESISSDYYDRYCINDYNKLDCPLYKKYGPYQSSGCFITTIVCDVLGNHDNCELLSTLRCFRDNVLQKDKKYYKYLMIYDNIGPVIADKIKSCDDKNEMSLDIRDNMLLPIKKLYDNGEYDAACEWYRRMTVALIYYYGLEDEYNNAINCFQCNSYFDPKTAGHGRKLVKSFG